MNFGFVRGSEYTIKQEHRLRTTSKDGFNSYLIIVDQVTRYTWIFLTMSKSQLINIVERVLNKFKRKNKHCTVLTDQRGDLGKSALFQAMIHKEKLIL